MTTDLKTAAPVATDAAATDAAARNLATVGAIYEAFGRGDVPFILAQLTDDISWDQGLRATEIPWLQGGIGTDAVVAFFTALAQGLQFTGFEPVSITSGGDHVVGVVRENAIALATGNVIPEDLFVHFWTFDAAGKVCAFRHIGDFVTQEVALGQR